MKRLAEILEGIITAVIIMVIFLIAVGPKTFGAAIFAILAFSFGAAGVAVGCTKILYREVVNYWYESAHQKDADEGDVSQ